MARSSTNPLAYSALFVLIIFTVAFTVLFLIKSGAVTRQYEGDPDEKSFKTITKLRGDYTDEVNKLMAKRAEREGLMRELRLADQASTQYRHVVSANGTLLASTATPKFTKATINGKEVDLPLSSWDQARRTIAGNHARLAKIADEQAPSLEKIDVPVYDEALQGRQAQLQDVNRRTADGEATFGDEMQRLQAQQDALAAEKEKVEKTQRGNRSTRQTNVTQLEDRIRDLLELELKFVSDINPDGQVLETDGTGAQVVINLGSRDRLLPGTLFNVFTYDRGRYLDKGRAEVIQVGEQVSTCRILTVVDPKRNPIGKDDSVGNPIWQAGKPKTFVLAGEFATYTKADLEGFIKATGGVVLDKLGPGCDFLVVQGTPNDRSDPERAAARQYQILAMTEAMLLQYVQTTYRAQ